MSQRPEDGNPFDPFAQWRTMRDSYLEQMSKMMIDLTTSEEYAQAQAQMLDTYLTMSAPFRKILETAMTQTLTQLNMPTRSDITNLAERLTNIEMRLDDLDAKLDDASDRARQAKAEPRPKKGQS
jgi:hypothetical protein